MAAKSTKTFSIKEAVSYGWKQATSRLTFFVLLIIIMIAASALPGIIGSLLEDQNAGFLIFIIQLVSWGLQLLVSLGLIHVALLVHDRKKATYKDLFSQTRLIIPYFLASVIYTLIIIAGFILLVIPGFVWAIKFRYFSYLMVDKKLGPIDAIKQSGKITKGVKWQLFLFGLVLFGINILGALVLLVGLLVTIPLSMMAEAYVYRKLSSK